MEEKREREIEQSADDLLQNEPTAVLVDGVDYGNDVKYLLSTIHQLREELELKKYSMVDLEHNRTLLSNEKEQLRQENERLKAERDYWRDRQALKGE